MRLMRLVKIFSKRDPLNIIIKFSFLLEVKGIAYTPFWLEVHDTCLFSAVLH